MRASPSAPLLGSLLASFPALLGAALTIGPALAQSPVVRTPVRLGTTPASPLGDIALSSDAILPGGYLPGRPLGLSAAAWVDAASGDVLVSHSDGAGLLWSLPVRVDADISMAAKRVSSSSLFVHNGSVLAAWRDERFGTRNAELYVARSSNGGASFATEVRVEKGYPCGTAGIANWTLLADAGSDFVHALYTLEGTPDEGAGLSLSTSSNAGRTFRAPTRITTNMVTADFCGQIAGSSILVTFMGRGSSGHEVFLQRGSLDGTDWLSVPIPLGAGASGVAQGRPQVSSLDGSLIAVAWLERTRTGRRSLMATISPDGGLSWRAPAAVGGGASGVMGIESFSLAVNADDGVVLAWSDDRSGTLEVYTTASFDAGLSWCRTVRLSTGGGSDPTLLPGRRIQDPNWVAFRQGSPGQQAVALASSRDGGWFWNPAAVLSSNGISGSSSARAGQGTGSANIAFNQLYNNAMVTWRGGGSANLGGMRAPFLEAKNFDQLGRLPAFELTNFSGLESYGYVVLSTGLGAIPINLPPIFDPRSMGIGYTPLTRVSLYNPLNCETAILANGKGYTAPFRPQGGSLPPGISFFATGISIDLSTFIVGEVTDVLAVTVQ